MNPRWKRAGRNTRAGCNPRAALAFRVVALLLLHALAGAQAQERIAGRFIVKLKSGLDLRTDNVAGARFAPPALAEKAERWKVRGIAPLVPPGTALRKGVADPERIAVVTLSDPGLTREAMDDFALDDAVEYVEADHVLRIDHFPDDSAYASQWGMRRIGMERAWDLTRGSPSVVIGVIDTGVESTHVDLRAQFALRDAEDANRNGTCEPWPAGEIRAGIAGDFDGLDNDGNGFIDDVIGYDFVDQPGYANAAGGDYRDPDPDVADEHGHGTSVAGIIGARMDNAAGVAGVAPACRMMILRAFDARGIGAESDVARALAYAVANGARVVNMSFGDVQYSRVLRDMVRYAYAAGVTMVASSGNSQSDALHYPSAYDETISVGASSENDGLAGFSNFGSTLDMVAPGVDIVTTEKGNGYGSFNGTSASAPFVTGLAALVLSLRPEFTPEEVRGILISTARDLGAAGWDTYFGAGIIDAGKALALEHPTVVRILQPATDFGTAGTSVTITGTAASPFMTEFTLDYGYGSNPARWFPILEPQRRQAIAETLAVWDIGSLPDTTYTIRLSARGNAGATLEDRVVVSIERAPPQILSIGFLPCIDGADYGVAAGCITRKPTLARLFYRVKNSSDEWSSAVLEGGAENSLFIGTQHAGFIGRNRLLPGRTYELYFSATSAAGKESVARDGSRNFELTMAAPVAQTGFARKPYSLPSGRLYPGAPDLDADGTPEILVNEYARDGILSILEFRQGVFERIGGDAQGKNIPRGTGDVNGNGRADLLSSFVRHGYIDEAPAAGALPDTRIWKDETAASFWPITIADVDNDGIEEVLAVVDDSLVGVYRYAAPGQLTRIALIGNPTPPSPENRRNSFSSPRAAIGDFNGNGRTDLLFGDADGDFFIVERRSDGTFPLIWASEDDYSDASDFVAAGDFDGDGRTDFAIGVRTTPSDVIPFWYFGIYRMNSANAVEPIWSGFFSGVEESGQAGSFTRIDNSLTAANIDGDAEDELIITTFPELYVIDYNRAANGFSPSWMLPLVNTNAAVVADFDGNGIPEIGLGMPDSIAFFERDLPDGGPKPPRAIDVEYTGANQVRISWAVGETAPQYRLYKGSSAADLAPHGLLPVTVVTDSDIEEGKTYMYAIAAYDSTLTPRESPRILSRVLRPHAMPRVDTAIATGPGQVVLRVSQDMGTAIPPASAFLLDGNRTPESTALLDERSVLLTFATLPEGQHAVSVGGLRDGEGMLFDEQLLTVFVVPPQARISCTVDRVDFEPPRTLIVRFRDVVDRVTAEIAANYVLEPLGPAVSAHRDQVDSTMVRLEIGGGGAIGATGKEYILKVSNVLCASGEPITTGAGSTMGIVLNRQNLDDVFVFPNPLRESDGQDFVTFGNLTPRAIIRVYTVSGEFVAEIQETDGNGGVQWDLRDARGSRIPGGIYTFYATGTDSSGNAVAAKTGKFALAK